MHMYMYTFLFPSLSLAPALADSDTKSGSAMHGTRNTQFLPRALVDSFVS